MFKNALVYRITQWEPPTQAEIERRLEAARFAACAPSQPEAIGWVEPRGEKHGALLESVGGQLILQLCSESKPVPSGVVKQQLEALLDRIEADTGRRPKGKAKRELKEQVVHELLPRAFPKRSATWVWLDLQAKLVLVGATGTKKTDAVVTRLVELFGTLRLEPLQTALSPATAMAAWLSDKEAPRGFSIDRECELKQPDSEKAAVRYARHTLEIDEVGEHIKQGKLPTQLALTWNGRVSFVLTEGLALKRIKLLDVVLEGSGQGDADGGFDADVAITTGELRGLLPDLIEALGGPLERQPAAARRGLNVSRKAASVLDLGGSGRFCSPGLFPCLESYLFPADSNRASTHGQPTHVMVRRLIGAERDHLSDHLDSLPTSDSAVLQLANLGKRVAASDWMRDIRRLEANVGDLGKLSAARFTTDRPISLTTALQVACF